MRLSEMRGCDACGKNLIEAGMFFVARISTAIVSPRAMQQTMGVTSILGGVGAIRIAEALSPDPEVVVITGDEDKRLITEVFLCSDCYMESGTLIKAVVSIEE